MKRMSVITNAFLAMFIIAVSFVCLSSINRNSTYLEESKELEVYCTAETTSSDIIDVISHDDISNNLTESDDVMEEIKETQEIEETSVVEVTKDPYVKLTEDEINDLATLVYLEAGGESYECQKAVASVVVNRVTTSGKTLNEIMYEKNQFTPSNLIKCTEPTESTLNAVIEVCENGPSIPEYVTYFRADHYHDFSKYMVDYMCIDNTYFSYDVNLKSNLENDVSGD